MTIEVPGLRLGFLQSTMDLRDSTYSGTTHLGPSGSGQFMAVRVSTAAATDLVAGLCTASGQIPIGILQNKPSTGQAMDIVTWGVTKAVAGSTFGPGVHLQVDSSGAIIPYSSNSAISRCGQSLETVSAVGQIFAMMFYGVGPGSAA